MRSLKYPLLLLCCIASFIVIAQEAVPIVLVNPSFEGTPKEGDIGGEMIEGWYDCGFPGETIPDIHPKENSTFKVDSKPFHGNTYIGMVVRDNDTYERISQRLENSLLGGKCYEFSLSLARSLFYESPSRTSSQPVNFTTPAILRIWGGNSICDKGQLLDKSEQVIGSRWLKYDFRLEPERDFQYLILEVFYKTPTPFSYNGNILMDDASAIIPVPCEVEVAVAPPVPPPLSSPSGGNKPDLSPTKVVEDVPPKILGDLDRSKIRKGQTIQVDKLFFISDSFAITPPSYPVLEEIFNFLVAHTDVIVEIGGHTNNIPTHDYCDNLSAKRAKAVADYLLNKGIPKSRVEYKGYGKRNPLVSNSTLAGRKKNQRVEIKILSVGGDG